MIQTRHNRINQSETLVDDELTLLERIQAVLEKEKKLARKINQLLTAKDLGDLNRADIVQAKLRIHYALQAQQDSIEALRRAIENLSTALDLLGWELELKTLSR